MDILNNAISKAAHDYQNQTKKMKEETEDPNPVILAEAKTAYEAVCKVLEKADHSIEVAA